MTYFSCVGYIIDSSGGPELLCDTDVLDSGSVNRFLSGKHFNRCKRMHFLLTAALQNLPFEAF